MLKRTNRNSRGFTILELMVAMALFLVLSGAVLGAMGDLQKNYRTRELRNSVQQQLRATMELMAQEIGQAGLQSSTVENDDALTSSTATPTYARYMFPSGVTSAAFGSGATVAVSTPAGVPSVAGIYVGQWLQVDAGANQDATQVTWVSPPLAPPTIKGNFSKIHAVGAVAFPVGVFPHGILAGTGDPSTPGDATHASKLAFFGEINGPGGGLVAVEYACPTPGAVPKSLMRTEWNAVTGTMLGAGPAALIDNVTSCQFCWPGATGCPAGAAALHQVTLPDATTCPLGCTYTMVTQVGFTVTVQVPDTTSGTTITVTKSYANIQPRNIIAADAIATAACTSAINNLSTCGIGGTMSTYLNGELQPDPPSFPLGLGIVW